MLVVSTNTEGHTCIYDMLVYDMLGGQVVVLNIPVGEF